MTHVTYVVGDVTRPLTVLGWRDPTRQVGSYERNVIVAHACNNGGGWGAGVSGAIGRRWPTAERWYRDMFLGGALRPGDVQCVPVPTSVNERRFISVANLIVCRAVRRDPGDWLTRVNLEWLLLALDNLTAVARAEEADVHMPRIGCGLAGGDWARDVEPIVQQTLIRAGVSVFVYDLPAARDIELLKEAK